MLLTNTQLLLLAQAIAHLDGGHTTQVIEGKAVEIWRGYRIAAVGRLLLTRACGLVRAALDDFDRARDALINQHSAGTGKLTADSPGLHAFSADFEKLKQQTVELPLEPISLDHLKLEENEKLGNELPIAVLNALSPLIKTTNPAETHA